MRILLAVDGSPFSEAAVSEVASRPWPASSEVRVVTAFQVPLIPTPEVWAISDEYLPALEPDGHRLIQTACQRGAGTVLDRNARLTGNDGSSLAGSTYCLLEDPLDSACDLNRLDPQVSPIIVGLTHSLFARPL
jgi:hypothetical protein